MTKLAENAAENEAIDSTIIEAIKSTEAIKTKNKKILDENNIAEFCKKKLLNIDKNIIADRIMFMETAERS